MAEEELGDVFAERCKYNCFTCLFIKRSLITSEDIKTKHLVPYETSSNVVISVVYLMNNEIISKVIKMPKSTLFRSKIGLFQNEILFYNLLHKKFNNFKNFIPEYEVTNNCYSTLRQPIIIMQNLSMKGYTHWQNKLELEDLIQCITLLAWFHGNMYRIRNIYNEEYLHFLLSISHKTRGREKRKQRMNIR